MIISAELLFIECANEEEVNGLASALSSISTDHCSSLYSRLILLRAKPFTLILCFDSNHEITGDLQMNMAILNETHVIEKCGRATIARKKIGRTKIGRRQLGATTIRRYEN